MHKRTAHALVDSDDSTDIFLQDTLDGSIQSNNKEKSSTIRENVSKTIITYCSIQRFNMLLYLFIYLFFFFQKLTTEKETQLQVSKVSEDITDPEPQILLVSDPSHIAALQVCIKE